MINYWFSKNFLTGGNIYNRMAFDSLKDRGFDISEKKAYTGYHGRGFTYIDALYTYFSRSSSYSDIDIMDYGTATWSSERIRGKCIITMFHFDLEETTKKRKHLFFFNRFLNKAKDSKVIVISQYWKTFLDSMGIKDIEIIYCAYDVDKYKQYLSRNDFLQKYHLPDKKIIYLGKNSKPKTVETWEKLKSLSHDYLIITTGPRKEFDGPIHLDLDFEGYCSLLFAASVTVTMPRFSEGWSRIAHESLLCGTPVIGNGKGGMKELLKSTNQYIITEHDPSLLIDQINVIISSGSRVAEKDILYAKSFDLNYFGDRWEKVIKSVLGTK